MKILQAALHQNDDSHTALNCSFFVLAVLRSMTSGYTVPYMVFAVIAVIGGILIVAVKEKKVIQ